MGITQTEQGKITALYCRLSKGILTPANRTQSSIRKKYSRNTPKTTVLETHAFRRRRRKRHTVFKTSLDALLAEVRTGGVATVIIKDQSRIGRDVIEVGLLKRTFDEFDVRLIAANDNLDTANGFDIMSIFRDVFNEWFVADTSKRYAPYSKAKHKTGSTPIRSHPTVTNRPTRTNSYGRSTNRQRTLSKTFSKCASMAWDLNTSRRSSVDVV